ncbi:MAG: helix-turn-helix domain-containing protein [Bacteroidetes bacterium]|nr:MAG: helix-turn-helix domain-containing protein [Bacteroidota bacterium]
MTTLYIKNMVCPRCIKVVKEELERLGLDIRSVRLGEVEVGGALQNRMKEQVKKALERNGFELIEDPKVKIIEKVKHAVLDIVQNDESQTPNRLKHSEYIAREVGKEYHYISVLFSSVENVTIEQYLILQKVERAKELLKYGEQTLSEIAYMLGYSSVQHLSAQFKNVTGMTPSKFKAVKQSLRKPIDKVGE